MFPFVIDHRAYHAAFTNHSSRRSSSSSDRSASPPSTITNVHKPSACGSGGGNSFRNPYSFTSTYQTKNKHDPPSSSSSSTSSKKSRLAAINTAFDNEYGSCDGNLSTAEELRDNKSQDRAGRSSTSSSSSSYSTSSKASKRSLKDRILRRNKHVDDDTESLVDVAEGKKLRSGVKKSNAHRSSWEDQYFVGSQMLPFYVGI